jgi:hypothetical protein
MTINKMMDIVNYINDYIVHKENNYKTFNFFYYNNFIIIMRNLLNADYDNTNNCFILNNLNIYINNYNNEKYEVYINDNDLIEPKGPI